MPGLVTKAPVTAAINFDVPESRLGHSKQIYEVYVVDRPAPTEKVVIPLVNLRGEHEQEGGQWRPALEQLEERGFAVVDHKSEHAGPEINTPDGLQAYLTETIGLFKSLLGASEVISWNSVIRRNDPSSDAPKVEARQLAPEEGLPPTKSPKVVASAAHVDQDEAYGKVICRRAAGEDVFERYSRVQIVNLWRPLIGPVTNAPLAVGDFRTFDCQNDLSVHASVYGTGLGVTYNPEQTWSYIPHQLPSEAILLKCYDSEQGENGSALFGPHVACTEVFGEPALDGEHVPRTSIEVRLVVLHK